jgi:hypothetical protein
MILKPLQRILVLESTKKFKPGSLGYFVAQDRVSNFNMWDMCIVFTKFGKKGKARIEPASMHHYMIDYATMGDSDREIMDIAKVHEKIEPAQYMDRYCKVLGATDEIKIEPFPIDSKNLLDLSNEEFTAYIVALSIFIHKMVYSKVARNLIQAPLIKSREFVEAGFHLGLADPESIGYYILYGMQYDAHTKKAGMVRRRNFQEIYNSQISTESAKRDLLNRLHRGLAMAKDSIRRYEEATEIAFRSNSARVSNVLKYYRKHKKELKQIAEGGKLPHRIPRAGWFEKNILFEENREVKELRQIVEEEPQRVSNNVWSA